ncbi:hypothetical protein GQ54DRAFT_270290 [Martensiomyces pterosporus]|nr:hypothetical protein GQ54DRAFT_270290 [Martensiomyces pterosporus]
MEAANKLARQAAGQESERNWDEAAKLHRQASEAYRKVDDFEFDPVATLTISSLTNKHARWAEYCEREGERQQNSSDAGEPSSTTGGPPKDSRVAAADKVAPNSSTTDTAARGSSAQEEREFEDFWQYMQNWLANPAAFTRPTVPPSGRSVGNKELDASASTRSVMESFYFVGPNPEQSSSMYASAAATPKTMSPLQVLDEVDETSDAEQLPPQTNTVESLAPPAGVDKHSASMAALLAENQRLRDLVMHLRERVRTLESAAQENSMLKSSILNFREEFHRHANAVSLPRVHEQGPSPRRAMAPPATHAAATDAQVRQLESQLQVLQIENSKQKAQMAKYRDRWEKLKDSAKRKRQQQLQQQQQLHQ